jgi:hypothetical protein
LAIEGSVAAATEIAATAPAGPVAAAGTPHEVLPLAAALAIAALAVIGATSSGAEARRSVRTRLGAAGALVILAGLAGTLSPPVIALAVAAVLSLAATADRAPPSSGPV